MRTQSTHSEHIRVARRWPNDNARWEHIYSSWSSVFVRTHSTQRTHAAHCTPIPHLARVASLLACRRSKKKSKISKVSVLVYLLYKAYWHWLFRIFAWTRVCPRFVPAVFLPPVVYIMGCTIVKEKIYQIVDISMSIYWRSILQTYAHKLTNNSAHANLKRKKLQSIGRQ